MLEEGFYTLVSNSKPRVQTLWPVPALPGLRDPGKRKSFLFQPFQVLLARKCMDTNFAFARVLVGGEWEREPRMWVHPPTN